MPGSKREDEGLVYNYYVFGTYDTLNSININFFLEKFIYSSIMVL